MDREVTLKPEQARPSVFLRMQRLPRRVQSPRTHRSDVVRGTVLTAWAQLAAIHDETRSCFATLTGSYNRFALLTLLVPDRVSIVHLQYGLHT